MTEENARPLGEWLRQRREELDISLEQAQEDTRIRARYLEALETEKFDVLPDPVVGRGFLRNYAAYLELDPQVAIDRFAERVAPPEPEPSPDEGTSPFSEPFRPMPLHEMPSRLSRRNWGLAILAVLALIAALSLLIFWGYPRLTMLLARQGSTPAPTLVPTFTRQATSAAQSTATHTPTSLPAETEVPTDTTETQSTPSLELTVIPTFTPSPSPSPSPSVYTGIFIELVFTDTSWIQVTVDGVRQFQGELESRTYRSWYGEERVELRVGNAGAVQVTVNGQFLGPLGSPGEVVDRVFEKVGGEVTEATVTPEITGTVTIEPTRQPPAEPTQPPTAEPTVTPPGPTITPTVALSPTATVTPTTPVSPTTSP